MGYYPDLAFLSNHLLVVSINQRIFGPVEPLDADKPASMLLLFDVTKERLISSRSFVIEKEMHSVQAIGGERFVLLNQEGLRACSADLSCGPALPSRGPIFVSPQGSRLAVGGNSQTRQKLLEAATFKTVREFNWPEEGQVIPGDSGLLIRRGSTVRVISENRDVQLPLGGLGVWPEERFLNDSIVAGFDFHSRTLFVSDLDGRIKYRKPVKAPWDAGIIASADGHRFAIHESGYTRMNSIVNFLDIDHGRPENLEKISVFDVESGRELLHLEWDPRPFVGLLAFPALSPDGRKVAVIHSGHLEVFDVP